MSYLAMVRDLRSVHAVISENHILLRLSQDGNLVIEPQQRVTEEVEAHVRSAAPSLVTGLMVERDEWVRHWRGLMQDLIDGFDRYMSDDCTDAEHNRWVGLLNLTEYAELEVLRSRYGFMGCPAEDGECDPDWPMRCRSCADQQT